MIKNKKIKEVMKAKLIYLVVFLLLGALSLSANVDASLDGDGSSSNPYQITNCTHLQEMKNNLTADYILMSNIDCSITSTWNSNAGFEPVGNTTMPFRGSLDGNGYNITNMVIYRPSATYLGLFGDLDNNRKIIKNLGIHNANITASNTAGVLAGRITNSTIVRVSVSGVLRSLNILGGLTASIANTTVYNSSATCNLTTTGTGQYNVNGGFVGWLGRNVLIESCFADSIIVSSDASNGGFYAWTNGLEVAGHNTTVNNSYSKGAISGSGSYTAGFGGPSNGNSYIRDSYTIETMSVGYCVFGAVYGTVPATNLFYDSTACTRGTGGGGTAKTTTQMKTESTFTAVGWDFTNKWIINASKNSGYPYLLWQDTPVPNSIRPLFDIVSPTNNSIQTDAFNLTFNATNASALWYYNGTENISYMGAVSLNLSPANYNYILYMNYSNGTIVSENLFFTVASNVEISFANPFGTGGNITYEGEYTIHTFSYTGSEQNFIIGSNINATIYVWGGGGAGGSPGGWVYGAAGGAGGAANGSITLTKGVTYDIVVGGGGVLNSFASAFGGGGKASNNNADNRYAGGGGGYSGLFLSSISQTNALLIAGGGGGGAASRAGTGNAGGAGGGTSGQVGYSPYDGKAAYGGNPGNQTSAGADASCSNANTAGGQGVLQGGTVRFNSYGGGGGGGYWGGSAGGYSESNTMGGGGGGSGYYNSTYVSSANLATGVGTTPGDSANAFRGTAGTAGIVSGNGAAGVVIIKYLTPTLITEENNSVYARDYIFANFDISGSNFVNVTYNLYNSTSLLDSTSYYSTENNSINWTNLPNEVYYYNATAYDLFNTTITSETRMITLDTTVPNGTLISPANNTSVGATSINFTANISDNLGIQNATLSIVNATDNETISTHVYGDDSLPAGVVEATIGIVVSLTDGVYNWFYSIFDWAGNQFNTETNQVTVDLPPVVTLTSPAAGISLTQFDSLTCSVADMFGVENITLYLWNETGLIYNDTQEAGGATLYENTWNYDLTDGEYNYNCLAVDSTLGSAAWAASNVTTQVDASNYTITNGNFVDWGNFYYSPSFTRNFTFNVTSTSVIDQDLTFELFSPGKDFSSSAYIYHAEGNCGGDRWGASCDTYDLIDGNWDTYYGISGYYNSYIQYDLASQGLINEIKIAWYPGNNWYSPGPYYFQYYDSNTGEWLTPDGWKSWIGDAPYLESGTFGGSSWGASTDVTTMTDGDPYTYFGISGNKGDGVVTYSFDNPRTISSVNVMWYRSSPGDYYFEYKDVDGNWQQPTEWQSNDGNQDTETDYAYSLDTPVEALGLRLYKPALGGGSGTGISEFTFDSIISPSYLINQDFYTEYTFTLSTPVTTSNIRLAKPSTGSNSGIGISEMTVSGMDKITTSNNGYMYLVGSESPTYTIAANALTQISFPLRINAGSFSYNLYATATRTRFGETYDYSSPSYWINFIQDLTPPALVGNISYSPNQLDNIDPETFIQMNATMTDAGIGLANATFQSFYNGTWHNLTTELIGAYTKGGKFGANFTTASVDKNYTIRLWSIDSVGNAGYTANTTIKSEWDCTWNIAPSSFEETIGFYEDKPLGNITLINTGDVNYSNNNCSIEFTLGWSGFSTEYLIATSDPERWLTGNTYFQFPLINRKIRVSAKTNQTVLVNVSFPSTESPFTETPLVLVSSSINDSITRSKVKNVSTEIIISPPNPLLYQAITESPTSYVSLTPGNISLNAFVRNLGYDPDNAENTTAYNVTFNWTLPSALYERLIIEENVTNETLFFDVLNTSERQFNNLTIALTDANLGSMSKGILNLTIFSYGYSNASDNSSLIVNSGNKTLLNETVSIEFKCYEVADNICVSACGIGVDPDCVASPPGSNGGGGGGGGGGGSGSFDKSSATFELVRGDNQEFSLALENKLSNPKKDITITIKGNNSQYVIPSPNLITYLGANSNKTIKFLINAPSYFSSGKYLLEITFSGTIEGNTSTKFTEVRYVTLMILEMKRTTADEYLNNSLEFLSKMNESGLILDEVQSILNSMNSNYESLNFNLLKEEAAKIAEIYTAATEYSKLRDELNQSMIESEKNGIEVSETKKLFLLAEILFNRGDYVAAYAKMKEAKTSYLLETKGEFKILYAIKNNPIETLGILISLSAIGLGSGYFIRLRLLKRKLRMLTEEEGLLLQLMRVVQRDCFENNKMSMEEYGEAMYQYEARLGIVIQDKVTTETQIANLMKLGGKKKALGQERDRLTILIRQTQDDYMNRGRLDTRIYENMLKTYATRLSKIEEQLVFIEVQEQINQVSGFWQRWFGKN